MKKEIIVLGLIIGTLLASNPLNAQIFPNLGGQRVGISGLTFLKNDLSPRSMAMGGAHACLSPDGYSLFANPAIAAGIRQTSFAVSNMAFGGGLQHSALAGYIPAGEYGTWTIGLHNLYSGPMAVRTEFAPEGNGQTFYTLNLAAGVGYSRALSRMFSFGIFTKYIREQIAEYSAQTLTFDLGFLYKTDYKDLRFAAAIQHFGTNSALSGSHIASGFNRQPPSLESYPSPTLFKMGASMKPWQDGQNSLLVALQLDHPNDNAENIRLGLEYGWNELFFARTGYKINVAGQKFPSAGLGVNAPLGRHRLCLDYGYTYSSYMGGLHSLGLVFSVNKTQRTTPTEASGE